MRKKKARSRKKKPAPSVLNPSKRRAIENPYTPPANRRAALIEFVRERKKAFRYLSEKRLIKFLVKYEIKYPKEKRVFWPQIHKQRLRLADLYWFEKLYSRLWLALKT